MENIIRKSINKPVVRMEIPYFQVPNSAFDVDMDKHQLLVYFYLCRCGNHGGTAFPSYATIAAKCDISRRMAIETCKALIDKGLLKKTTRATSQGGSFTNVYVVDYPEKKEEATPSSTQIAPSPVHGLHPPSAQCAPPLVYALHPPSAQCAPYKELVIKNQDIKNQDKETHPEGAEVSEISESGFEEFWNAYPKKIGKKAAQTVWEKIGPGPALHGQIMAAIALAQTTRQWQHDEGRYIPHPTTWLNEGRWTDQHTKGEVASVRDFSHLYS